jgi:hypothetical protein
VAGRSWPALLVLALVACRPQSGGASHERSTPNGLSVSAPDSVAAYPRARWRLAPTETMGHVVLWVSHIEIRHSHSDREMPSFPGWTIEPAPPGRSREEALILATSLAARAAAAPETFERLAQQYSEDVVTSATGGSLGGVSADRLLLDSGFLDALASLRYGEVSRVVETSHGFHVLMRRAPPAPVTLAARRVAVRYDRPPYMGRPWPPVGRSRSEAYSIARAIEDDLSAHPAHIDGYLAEYPPTAGADPSGDVGVWTNQEAGLLAREREQIAALAIGSVSAPIDSPEGFQVFLRTEVPPRPVYAVQLVQRAFGPDLPPQDPASRESVRAALEGMARDVASGRERFETLQRRYCCLDTERWGSGRTSRALVEAVADVPIGGVSGVLERSNALFLARRAAPESIPGPSFDLPAPDAVDVQRIAASYSGKAVQKLILDLGDSTSASLGLDPEGATRLKALHAQFSEAFRDGESEETREHALTLFSDALRGQLSGEQYERYRTAANRVVAEKVVGSTW